MKEYEGKLNLIRWKRYQWDVSFWSPD